MSMLRSSLTLVIFMFIGLFESSVSAQWVQVKESVYTLPAEISTNSKGHLFLAGSNVQRTTTKGDSWQVLTVQGIGSSDCLSIKVASDDKIYLGTLKGLARSTNNGASWSWFTDAPFHNLPVFDVLPFGKNGLYIGTNNAIHWSTNGGQDWEGMSLENSSYNATKLAIDSAGNVYFVIGSRGLLRTYDDLVRSVDDIWNVKVYDVEVAPNGDIYVGLGGGVGLMQSRDNGLTWREVNNHLNIQGVGNIAVHKDGSVFVSSGSNIYVTTDRGDSWKVDWENAPDGAGAMTISPDNTMYVAPTRYGTIYRRTLPSSTVAQKGLERHRAWLTSQVVMPEQTLMIGSQGVSNLEVSITDAVGRVIVPPTAILPDSDTFNFVPKIPLISGVYVVTLRYEGGMSVERILVQ